MFVPPDDEKVLSSVISELLANNNLQAFLAFRGQNRVLEEFNISRTIKDLHVIMLDKCINSVF